MKEGTFYFAHDYNTRNDFKIKLLLSKHGMKGYGVFWALIEELYNNANALPTDYDCIAFDIRSESEIVKSVINDFDLFVFNGDKFGSLSIQNRMDDRNKKSEKARESAFYRWNKCERIATLPKRNAIKERKVKESKVKKRKDSVIFSPPLLKDVIEYFDLNGYSEVSANRAYKYYSEANWHDSQGKPVKNWKQKMISVWFKPENKKIEQPQKTTNADNPWK